MDNTGGYTTEVNLTDSLYFNFFGKFSNKEPRDISEVTKHIRTAAAFMYNDFMVEELNISAVIFDPRFAEESIPASGIADTSYNHLPAIIKMAKPIEFNNIVKKVRIPADENQEFTGSVDVYTYTGVRYNPRVPLVKYTYPIKPCTDDDPVENKKFLCVQGPTNRPGGIILGQSLIRRMKL